MRPLIDRRILLGVTGSIAAYKSADLASKLTQAGAQVDVILTGAALQFVSPLTFQSVTGRRAFTDEDLWGREGHVRHIGLGVDADLTIIAPLTANTLAKLAHGLADNLLSLTALAATCPLMLAPAMDGGMFTHAATQANLALIRQHGAIVVGPEEGHLASGSHGVGRMVEPGELLGHIRLALSRGGPLHGRKVLVTAGGTQESIDPVRMITNRSSGKQGYALAQAALDLGADVTLVSAPVGLPEIVGVRRVEVRSAQEMLDSVLAALPETDVLVMAAAVADFRPANPASEKIKKGDAMPEIRLERTADILLEVAKSRDQSGWPRLVVGFAAESSHLLENAHAKLEAKRLDMIVANDISAPDAGFGFDTNRVTLLEVDREPQPLPLMSKEGVGVSVMERVSELLLAREQV